MDGWAYVPIRLPMEGGLREMEEVISACVDSRRTLFWIGAMVDAKDDGDGVGL